jgi:signal peptidase I
MPPDNDPSPRSPADGRIIAYRAVRWVALVVGAFFIIKLFLFDTILICTDQMTPTLFNGDRVLVWRTFSAPLLSNVFVPLRKSPVVFENRRLFPFPACLRVAARPGDSVCVSRGHLAVLNKPSMTFSSKAPSDELLPPDFSPRDSMSLYVVPKKGDAVTLDSLSSRDFFFASSLIRQENPNALFSVKPELFIDGSPSASFVFSDFYLYKGRLDSVPARFEFDWFFWARAKDYIVNSLPGKDVDLTFSLYREGAKLYRYAFSKSCIFLLADDWRKGFDSRFFGPVISSSVKGRVLCVLWSFGRDPEGNKFFRINRLFKIIR